MTKIRLVEIVYWLSIIGADILVYIIFGVLLMGYEDSWDNSRGEFWSLRSMNLIEKVIYLSLQIWNLLNAIGIIFIIQKIYKRIKILHSKNLI